MARTTFEQLLEAGAHFGHQTRKWNPHMAPYLFGEKKGIHIIDLHKTIAKIDDASAAMKQIAKSGKKILLDVTTKFHLHKAINLLCEMRFCQYAS